MTPTELRALIDARVASDPAFAARVAARDDTAVAAALNAGRTRLQSRFIGAGTIIATLGRPGAELLRAMRQAAGADPLIDEGVRLIDRGEWDIGSPATQEALQGLVAAQALPEAAAHALMALGYADDPVVTQDAVGYVLNRRGKA